MRCALQGPYANFDRKRAPIAKRKERRGARARALLVGGTAHSAAHRSRAGRAATFQTRAPHRTHARAVSKTPHQPFVAIGGMYVGVTIVLPVVCVAVGHNSSTAEWK